MREHGLLGLIFLNCLVNIGIILRQRRALFSNQICRQCFTHVARIYLLSKAKRNIPLPQVRKLIVPRTCLISVGAKLSFIVGLALDRSRAFGSLKIRAFVVFERGVVSFSLFEYLLFPLFVNWSFWGLRLCHRIKSN